MKKIYFALIAPLCVCMLCGCKRKNQEVTILFTNDTHGNINKTLSFASASQMKKDLKNEGKEVLLLDAGDQISGGFYTTYDNGASMINFMNMAGYDAATLGNHEFDYNFSYLEDLIKRADYPYISTNFYHMVNGKPTSRFTDLGSKVFSLKNGLKVGVVGVSTPDSITTSTPSHFQDESGNYIYTFRENDLYSLMQNEIDAIRDKCDYVICLSHLGDKDQDVNYTATKLANRTSGIDVIIDGHTHFSVPGITVKDKNNKDVFITQAGGTFSRIGKMTISKNNGIKNELVSSYDRVDEEIANKEKAIVKELDEKMGIKIATSEIRFSRGDSEGNIGETNLGDLVAEAQYYFYNEVLSKFRPELSCDVSFVNSGGIRVEEVPAKTWTVKDCFNIHSFSNGTALIKMKGRDLLTALEFSSCKLPNYFGGLQQTCGIKYTVDTSKTSEFVVDKNGNYVSGPTPGTERIDASTVCVFDRVKNQYVSLDLNKEYLVGGSSYVLIEGGDGMSMFKNKGKIVRTDNVMVDNAILALYISSFEKTSEGQLPMISNATSPFKNTSLEINYTDPGFGKRINIKQQS